MEHHFNFHQTFHRVSCHNVRGPETTGISINLQYDQNIWKKQSHQTSANVQNEIPSNAQSHQNHENSEQQNLMNTSMFRLALTGCENRNLRKFISKLGEKRVCSQSGMSDTSHPKHEQKETQSNAHWWTPQSTRHVKTEPWNSRGTVWVDLRPTSTKIMLKFYPKSPKYSKNGPQKPEKINWYRSIQAYRQ